jgi:putative RNA 2'-phosphotransferase
LDKLFSQISKFLSYILRHHPEKFNLSLDKKGFAKIRDILIILNRKYKTQKIDTNFIKELIKKSDKKRFEIVEDKIRAFYGHSIKNKIRMHKVDQVPINLFHGTSLNRYQKIKREGLKRKKRQYVHLSESVETAYSVGKRKTNQPVILIIDSVSAQKHAIPFYKSGDMYLADYIPPKYISLYQEKTASPKKK